MGMLSELLPQDQNENCRGPDLPPPNMPLVILIILSWSLFFLKLALFKKTQDSKEPVTLPLYMLKEIQIEKPASGRELEHIHLNTYELSVVHSIHAHLFGGLSSVSYRFWGLSKNLCTTCLLFLIYQ